MTKKRSYRSRIVAAGVVAAVSAGLATGALAAGDAAPPTTTKDPRIAVLATVGTPAPDVSRAISTIQAGAAQAKVIRAGGALDAQAEAVALAAAGYDVVVGVGDAGRAAVGQAESAGVGDGTRWVTVR